MAIAGIESVLQQLNVLKAQATGNTGAATGARSNAVTGPSGFASELKASLARVSAAQNSAQSEAQAFELGKPGIGLNDVMVDMQKANIGFQMSLQVRNKLVSAYSTIMNLQV